MNKNKNYNTLKAKRESETHISNEGYTVKIINYISSLNCTIVLDNTIIINNVNYHQIKKGQIKNPLHKSVYGVACLGIGAHIKHVGKKPTICYDTWVGMLRRVYDKSNRRPTYKNVSICEQWHNYQNFADWFYKNYDESYMKSWHLDKDLLSKYSKIYSPETCCFLPSSLNTLLSKKIKNNSVPTKSGKFESILAIGGIKTYLGTFKSKKEADEILYSVFKERLLVIIKDLPTHLQKAFIEKFIENE